MTAKERDVLRSLMEICNTLGSSVDLSAISLSRLVAMQRAHKHVGLVLYGLLAYHPDSDYKDQDLENINEGLHRLQSLVDMLNNE